ncbi:MAG: GNAT family N-acetyltransferase [Myxococcota bacterium]
MPRYSVRALRPDDFDLLMQLEEELFGDDVDGTLGPYYVRLCCEHFGDSCFLLLAGDEPAGYLLGFTKGREAFCTTLALLPRFQGSRALIRLLQAYIAAIEKTCDECVFTVEPGNEAARALHKMLGASESELRRNYYGPGRDRIVSKIDRRTFEALRERFARLGLLRRNESARPGRPSVRA